MSLALSSYLRLVLPRDLIVRKGQDVSGIQDFQKGSLPFIQTNDIASVLLVEKERNGE